METITSIASAASKAVFGDGTAKPTTEEPVSGTQGNTSAGEPFDAGNKEPVTTTPAGTTETTPGTSTGTTTGATTGNLTDRTKDSSTTATGHNDPEGTHGPHSSKVANAVDPTVDSDKDGKDALQPSGTTPPTNTSSKDKPSTTTNSGNDTRAPEDSLDPKTVEARHNIDDTGDGLDTSENPVKVDGPGPKPVDELAREHGGDAGAAAGGATSSSTTEDEATSSAVKGEDPSAPSTGEGTGEQYIKSSGLMADGGNFDATKPGAGKEADRLLETKGLHNPSADVKGSKGADISPTASKDSVDVGSPDSKDKKSLKDKIKAKLHKS